MLVLPRSPSPVAIGDLFCLHKLSRDVGVTNVDVTNVSAPSGKWCLFCLHKLSIEDVDVISVPTPLPPVASGDLFCLHKLSREDVSVTCVDVTNKPMSPPPVASGDRCAGDLLVALLLSSQIQQRRCY